ncbi:MAG: 16S rRNA (guanine(527)-N(7))-methyltransferase RsmG [Nitrospirota bacterium]
MTLRRSLIDGATAFGIALTDEQADSCLVYLVELEKWNRKINLTAIRGEQEIIIKHFIDSFSYVKGFDPRPGLALLDMGSGAGFPALPIKIAFPDMNITLVESIRKKATFLRHIIRTLKLERAVVVDSRTDALPDNYRSNYDVVTARAFADMSTALREGAVFLKPGGLMVLSRGPEETVSGEAAADHGMVLESRLDLNLPVSGDPRAIWIFRKTP